MRAALFESTAYGRRSTAGASGRRDEKISRVESAATGRPPSREMPTNANHHARSAATPTEDQPPTSARHLPAKRNRTHRPECAASNLAIPAEPEGGGRRDATLRDSGQSAKPPSRAIRREKGTSWLFHATNHQARTGQRDSHETRLQQPFNSEPQTTRRSPR